MTTGKWDGNNGMGISPYTRNENLVKFKLLEAGQGRWWSQMVKGRRRIS